MKKLLAIILAFSMLFPIGLTSCVKNSETVEYEEKYHGTCKGGKPHNFATSKIKADCTNRGYTLNTCKTCGYVFLDGTKAALGHDFSEEESVVQLGCTTDGKIKKVCKRCGKSSESIIPHVGHTYEISPEYSDYDDGTLVYICTACDDSLTLGTDEDLPEEKEETVYLPDCPADFSFDVICDSESSLQRALTITDENGEVDYEAVSNGDGRYCVKPSKDYVEYGQYTATLTDAVNFADYNTQTLEFSIVGPDRTDVEFKDENIVFLKKLEEQNKGYYPYKVEWDELAEKYYVTLSKLGKINDSMIGKIIAVGDYLSIDEIVEDPTRELIFGKLVSIVMNSKGKPVLELALPEMSEIFDKYDVYFSANTDIVDAANHLSADEDIELEFAAAVVTSDGFAEYLTTVQLAAESYANDHGLQVVPLSSNKNGGKFKFGLTKKTLSPISDSAAAKLELEGNVTYTIDLKENNSNINAGSITIKCTAGITSILSIGGEFEDNEKVDIHVVNDTEAELNFSVQFDMEYSQKYEEKFLVNNKSKKIHTSSCRIATEQTDSSNLTTYTAEELIKKYGGDKEAMKKDECGMCRAVKGLDGTGYVLNKKTDILHCMDCISVGLMKDCNVYTIYPANTIPFKTCENCKPEERQPKDFEARMINKLYGADLASEVNAFKKSAEGIFGKSKLKNETEPAISLPLNIAGVFNIKLGVQPVFEFDIKASLNFTVTASSSSTIGIRSAGKDGVFETYKSNEPAAVTYDLSFMGEVDAKLGIALSVQANPVGCENIAVIKITGTVGVYGHLSGALSTSRDSDGNSDAYCGARLDVGVFFDVCGYWKILWFDDNFTIVDDMRISLQKWGYDRIYYSFVDSSPEIDMNGRVWFNLSEFMTSKYLDLQTMNECTGEIPFLNTSKYDLKVEIKNADGSPCDKLKFSDITGKVEREFPTYEPFTAFIYVTVEPKNTFGNATFPNTTGQPKVYKYFGDTLILEVNVEADRWDEGELAKEAEENLPGFILEAIRAYYNLDFGEALTDEMVASVETLEMNIAGMTSDGKLFMDAAINGSNFTALCGLILGGGRVHVSRMQSFYEKCAELEAAIQNDLEFYEEKYGDIIPSSESFNGWYQTNLTKFKAYFKLYDPYFPGQSEKAYREMLKAFPDILETGPFYMCETRIKVTELKRLRAFYEFVTGEKFEKDTYTIPMDELDLGFLQALPNLQKVKYDEKLVVKNSPVSIKPIMSDNLVGYYKCGDNLTWRVEDGVLTIKGKGDMWAFVDEEGSIVDAPWQCTFDTVVISEGVTSIGEGAFYRCRGLTEITIPDSATSIGNSAFNSCRGLTEIIIPDSVTYIGDGAFSWCQNLTQIDLPNSLTYIGDYAFTWCEKLTQIDLPNSLTHIGGNAFAWCEKLTQIDLPNLLTYIGDCAFLACGIEDVIVPASVKFIGENALGTNSIHTITVDKNNKNFCDVDGVLFSKDKTKLHYYPSNKEKATCEIPSTVISIAEGAFSGCNNLKKITIPDSVTSIGDDAFLGCNGLVNITIPDSVTSIGDYAFHNCDSLKSITIPDSVTSVGGNAFSYCDSLTSITYHGTKAEWANLFDYEYEEVPYADIVICSDGRF